MRALLRALAALTLLVSLASCASPSPASPLAGCGTTASCTRDLDLQTRDEVDLLLVVDDTTAMEGFQAQLAATLPALVAALVAGDHDGDGTPDAAPARSLHFGIVTSDVGIDAVLPAGGCSVPLGDDGLMQTRSTSPASGCDHDYASDYGGRVFSFDPAAPRPASDVAADLACVVQLGTNGCGMESHLESMLESVSLAPGADGASPVRWTHEGYVPPTFRLGMPGHGSDPATNGAFLRPSSVLGVIVLANEDDCSTPNTAIFSPDDPRYTAYDIDVRCFAFADQLYPTQRYVDGLVGLRGRARQLVFAAIVGAPLGVSDLAPADVVQLPEMQLRTDDAMHLLPACTTSAYRAFPGRRIARVAEGLAAAGADARVHSVCDADYAATARRIGAALGRALAPSCLPSPLPTSGDGRAACRLFALAAEGADCGALEDAGPDPTTGRTLCEIPQRTAADAEPGWLYESSGSGCAQRVRLAGIVPIPGVVLVCPTP